MIFKHHKRDRLTINSKQITTKKEKKTNNKKNKYFLDTQQNDFCKISLRFIKIRQNRQKLYATINNTYKSYGTHFGYRDAVGGARRYSGDAKTIGSDGRGRCERMCGVGRLSADWRVNRLRVHRATGVS